MKCHKEATLNEPKTSPTIYAIYMVYMVYIYDPSETSTQSKTASTRDGAKNEDESEAQAASASVLCTKVAATMQKWLSFSHRLLGILHLVA